MGVITGFPTAGSVTLHNLNLVDVVDGAVHTGVAVHVQGGVISEITADDGGLDARHPALDLGGAYLAPGLINMHTHFSLSLPGPVGAELEAMDAAGLALYMADGARRTLHNGITTVRCVAEKGHADFALRRAIETGRVEGPRIYTAGRALACTGGHGHGSDDTLECDGADDFARGVRTQIKAGADLIKLMISGGIAGEHETISTPQLTVDEMAAAISTAHAWGRKVTAHAGPADVIAEAVKLGLDCVEHGYELTPEVCRAMAENGTSLVPTLIVTRAGAFFDELGVPAWMQERSLGAGERHLESYRAALDAGVDVLLGSDMPPFWPFEGTTAAVRELEHMHAAGLDAPSTLRAGTLGPARWLGIEATAGSIEVGKWADVIALPENPLQSPSALRTIDFVMKDGVVVRDEGRVR
ncbi:amidohydrolase family protein [Agromyces atrinae]|uniref:amidohydrolase family protein n=1 Tax=Agromyces atrinae TaxID=592376 RepID=UPI001F5A29CF|nr:amidohydrolase family protein [Agromyces atrinae]MCI2956545.1 amidohydrolase family protein [Agromyces atrinae]